MDSIKEKIKALIDKLNNYKDSNSVESLYVQLTNLDTESISQAVRLALTNTAWAPKDRDWYTENAKGFCYFGKDVYMSAVNRTTGEVSFRVNSHNPTKLFVNLAASPYSYIVEYCGVQYNLDKYEERVSLQEKLNNSRFGCGNTECIELINAFIEIWPKIEKSLYESITSYLDKVEGKKK